MGSEDNYSPWAVLIFMAGPLPNVGLKTIIHGSLHIPCLSMLSKWIFFLICYKLGFDFLIIYLVFIKEWNIMNTNVLMSVLTNLNRFVCLSSWIQIA